MVGTDVGAVVLAAGESRRFGGRKQLARLAGRTLLEHVLVAAHDARLSPIVAVVPIWLSRPRDWDAADLLWVRNAYPERGLSHSLQQGFAALPPTVAAALILLGDQPTIEAEAIDALLAARGNRPIVASRAGDVLGPPIVVERRQFDIVRELSGDSGLRAVLSEHPGWVTTVEVAAHPVDVDTPDDLAHLGQR